MADACARHRSRRRSTSSARVYSSCGFWWETAARTALLAEAMTARYDASWADSRTARSRATGIAPRRWPPARTSLAVSSERQAASNTCRPCATASQPLPEASAPAAPTAGAPSSVDSGRTRRSVGARRTVTPPSSGARVPLPEWQQSSTPSSRLSWQTSVSSRWSGSTGQNSCGASSWLPCPLNQNRATSSAPARPRCARNASIIRSRVASASSRTATSRSAAGTRSASSRATASTSLRHPPLSRGTGGRESSIPTSSANNRPGMALPRGTDTPGSATDAAAGVPGLAQAVGVARRIRIRACPWWTRSR